MNALNQSSFGTSPGEDTLAQTHALLSDAFARRFALVSPPRTGSTLVARMLWRIADISHHAHEPFEAIYWSGAGVESVDRVLLRPMEVATGIRVLPSASREGRSLLVKEMSFQADEGTFRWLASLANQPVVFVLRDPRSSTTSRLRIVRELSGAETFKPVESGWPALEMQVSLCRRHQIPYLIVDSDALRRSPEELSARFAARLGLDLAQSDVSWGARPELQLCAPEIRALMGGCNGNDDPFYRRVLASTGIEAPDEVDWDAEDAKIRRAGLSEHVRRWSEIRESLLADPNLIG